MEAHLGSKSIRLKNPAIRLHRSLGHVPRKTIKEIAKRINQTISDEHYEELDELMCSGCMETLKKAPHPGKKPEDLKNRRTGKCGERISVDILHYDLPCDGYKFALVIVDHATGTNTYTQ